MISRLYRYPSAFIITLAFALWFILFRHFVFNQLPLTDDAVAYFFHTRFYLLNLESGIFPYWDPDWLCGVPVDFFLRRIGNFNPFYLLIIILHKLGMPFRVAYLLFLVFYFYLGMIGFYMLSRTLIADKRASLAAFLLLCFSSLGTMLFFSFLHVVYVPLFWLFYFLISFFKKPALSGLLGATFTLMIVVSTYIPFYALVILCSFALFFALFYPLGLMAALRRAGEFVIRHKLPAILCVLVLALSCLPQILLFKGSTDGQVVLPSRHQGSAQESIYTVGTQKVAGGDAISQLYFDRLLRDHGKMENGIVYFPAAGFFIFLLGAFTKIDKKTAMMSVLAFFFFLITVTELSPVHGFLYERFFGFKFIRQSYFFFWIAILPILALIVGVQLEKLLAQEKSGSIPAKAGAASAVFLAGFIYLMTIGGVSAATFAVLVLCFALALGSIFLPKIKVLAPSPKRDMFLLLAIFMAIVLDPADAFRHIKRNEVWTSPAYRFSDDEKSGALVYRKQDFFYERDRLSAERYLGQAADDIATRPNEIYYASHGYNFLFENTDYILLRYYLNYRFVLYDQLQHIKDEALTPGALEGVLSFKDDRAIVDDARALNEHRAGLNGKAIAVSSASEEFQLLDISANAVKISARLPSPKFLVFNDSFHPDWRVAVNGQPREIYRANVAFKGVWLPAGESSVVFSFRTAARLMLDLMLAAVFAGMLAALIVVGMRERRAAEARTVTS